MNRVGFFDILGKRRWDQIALQEWQTIDLALDTAGIGRCATVLVHFTDLNEVARLSGEKPITDSERTPAMKNYLEAGRGLPPGGATDATVQWAKNVTSALSTFVPCWADGPTDARIPGILLYSGDHFSEDDMKDVRKLTASWKTPPKFAGAPLKRTDDPAILLKWLEVQWQWTKLQPVPAQSAGCVEAIRLLLDLTLAFKNRDEIARYSREFRSGDTLSQADRAALEARQQAARRLIDHLAALTATQALDRLWGNLLARCGTELTLPDDLQWLDLQLVATSGLHSVSVEYEKVWKKRFLGDVGEDSV